MMFWFNKWYSKQWTDYNIVARFIIILASRLPDSHYPALHLLTLASQLTLHDFPTNQYPMG